MARVLSTRLRIRTFVGTVTVREMERERERERVRESERGTFAIREIFATLCWREFQSFSL